MILAAAVWAGYSAWSSTLLLGAQRRLLPLAPTQYLGETE